MLNDHPPTIEDVLAAEARIRPFVHRTPTLTSRTLNAMSGAELYFKCENFQRVGAFKARGAHNAVFSLTPDQLLRGVVTHSSGNHAAALALAARNAGTVAHVVMPSNAPRTKVDSVKRLGGHITTCQPTPEARESTAAQVQAASGASLIHPFDNWQVIAGQATASLELIRETPDLQMIVAPVGGGGLLAGTAIVAQTHSISTCGAEPSGADDAQRSLRSGQLQPLGQVQTIADGLRTSVGVRPFEIIRQHVDDIATVSDEEIVAAMVLVWQILKIVIEPSAAVPVAALLNQRLPIVGKRIGIILSGGNVDLASLPWPQISPR